MNKVLCSTLRLALAASILIACDDGEAEPREPDASADGDAETACDSGDDCSGMFACPVVSTNDWDLELTPERVCDGIADCHGAEDEMDCSELENLFCAADDEGGRRVYRPDQVCDGRSGCFFAEDERDCPDSLICPIYQVGGGGAAIPKSKVCDGVWDCTIDEYDCPDVTDPFVCPNGKTIDRKFVCDQGADCGSANGKRGAADEVDPSCHQYACKRYDFDHERTACSACEPLFIPESKVCDGVRDCGEGDDEQDCPEPFACSGGLFARASARCDGKLDCPQGDDETGCP